MAFLIGQTAQERKDIAKTPKKSTEFVRRSFTTAKRRAMWRPSTRLLASAWTTFSRLKDLYVKYRTKAALVVALEDLKMP